MKLHELSELTKDELADVTVKQLRPLTRKQLMQMEHSLKGGVYIDALHKETAKSAIEKKKATETENKIKNAEQYAREINLEEADVKTLTEAMTQATLEQAELDTARAKLEEAQKEAMIQAALDQAELDTARAKLAALDQAELDTARAKLEEAQTEAMIQAALDQAELDTARAKAEAEVARAALAKKNAAFERMFKEIDVNGDILITKYEFLQYHRDRSEAQEQEEATTNPCGCAAEGGLWNRILTWIGARSGAEPEQIDREKERQSQEKIARLWKMRTESLVLEDGVSLLQQASSQSLPSLRKIPTQPPLHME